jgi:hypothetical protein
LLPQLGDVLLKRILHSVGVQLHVHDGLVDGGAHRRIDNAGDSLGDEVMELLPLLLLLSSGGAGEGVEDSLPLWSKRLHDPFTN